jgi:broad specificity phosphatase PhoE
MKTVLFMRHGETDYSGPRRWKARGWGADIAPLTAQGQRQVLDGVKLVKDFDPSIILSSPATRALHSASIICKYIDVPLVVEFDLHEWIPSLDFSWRSEDDVINNLQELELMGGEWPAEETRSWEPISAVRRRVNRVLGQYEGRILVVSHEIVIWALTGVRITSLAGFRQASHS